MTTIQYADVRPMIMLHTIRQAHQHGEDVVRWPILLDRGPAEITQVVQVMERHHDQIGKAAGIEVDPALRPVGLGMLMCEGDPEVIEVDMARMPPQVRELMKKTAPHAYEAHSLRVHGTLPWLSAD